MWASLVCFEVWDFATPVQIRASPFYKMDNSHKGFTLWFTGLSGAGKSTLAGVLEQKIKSHGRTVTVLDGDEIRKHLSQGLGFSKEDRDTNIRRVSYVAGEITRHRGVAIVACISPYRAIRDECRQNIGNFVEVFVDTPLEVCEQRDPKGLYKKARDGDISGFTGIDDPYESPRNPEVIVFTESEKIEESALKIESKLYEMGYLNNSRNL